jgi:hypothetical protein
MIEYDILLCLLKLHFSIKTMGFFLELHDAMLAFRVNLYPISQE